jgi:serine/threonine-protein kinase
MAQERYPEACPKLEESQKLDPAGGTLLHLAVCREREGRIATAWALYSDALSRAKRDKRADRAKFAQERIDVLGPRLPKMRVRVAPANRALPGFKLTRDALAVGEAQWGESVPVDPGARLMKAQADGRKAWTFSVDVPNRPNEITVEVPELEIDPDANEAAATPSKPDGKKGSVSYEDTTRGDTQRTLGIVAAGVGVAGIGLGAIFGLVSISKKNAADEQCRGPELNLCTQKGVDDGDAALQAGNISTIAFIAGAALAAGGAVLYFTAPDAATPVAVTPTFGPNMAALSLTAHFR